MADKSKLIDALMNYVEMPGRQLSSLWGTTPQKLGHALKQEGSNILGSVKSAITAPYRAYQGEFAPKTYMDENGNIITDDSKTMQEANNLAMNMATGGLGYTAAKPVGGVGTLGMLKVPELQEAAKAHFGTTYFPAETGYLMDDLSRLDFTGRHYAGGYNKIANRNIPEPGKPDYLKLQRSVDHRELDDLVGHGDNWQRMSDFMDKTGAVRYDINYGVSLVNKNKPNDKQIQMIVDDFRRKGNPLLIDVDRMSDGGNLASKEFTNPTFGEVKSWLDRQYNLHGDK